MIWSSLRSDFRRKASPSSLSTFPPHPPLVCPLPFSVYIFFDLLEIARLVHFCSPFVQPWAPKSSIDVDSRPTMGICLLTATCSLETRMGESGRAVLNKSIPHRCSPFEALVGTWTDGSGDAFFLQICAVDDISPLRPLQDKPPTGDRLWSVLVVDSGTAAGTFTPATSMCANVGGGPPGRSGNLITNDITFSTSVMLPRDNPDRRYVIVFGWVIVFGCPSFH